MNLMLFRGLASRLLLSKRKVKEETEVISITTHTQLTSADNGKTYSLDATSVFLLLPDHTGLADGFTVNVQCTQWGFVEVYSTFVGDERVVFDSVKYDGVRLQAAGDTATLVYSSSNSAWAATGTGTTIGFYD